MSSSTATIGSQLTCACDISWAEMIRHVVLWRLTSSGADSFERIRAALEGQQGKVPGLLRVEVGRNFGASRRAVDFCLICDFESRAALDAYHRHPAHHAVRAIVDPLIADHWIADYDL
jgi:quinol monooxygenase YgiN